MIDLPESISEYINYVIDINNWDSSDIIMLSADNSMDYYAYNEKSDRRIMYHLNHGS